MMPRGPERGSQTLEAKGKQKWQYEGGIGSIYASVLISFEKRAGQVKERNGALVAYSPCIELEGGYFVGSRNTAACISFHR